MLALPITVGRLAQCELLTKNLNKMTFTPQKKEKHCFIACSEGKVNTGLCDCINRPLVIGAVVCSQSDDDAIADKIYRELIKPEKVAKEHFRK